VSRACVIPPDGAMTVRDVSPAERLQLLGEGYRRTIATRVAASGERVAFDIWHRLMTHAQRGEADHTLFGDAAGRTTFQEVDPAHDLDTRR
jgi:hypothetical protein